MENKRILISGGGIAGLTLAFWLRRYGFEPTVLEIAPGVRGGGYMIDFWGSATTWSSGWGSSRRSPPASLQGVDS